MSPLNTPLVQNATNAGETHPAPPDRAVTAQFASELLLQGRRSVEITHNGNVYRLSATRMGKLILTK